MKFCEKKIIIFTREEKRGRFYKHGTGTSEIHEVRGDSWILEQRIA